MTWRLRMVILVSFLMVASAIPAGAATGIWRPMNAPSPVGRGYGMTTCLDGNHCWVSYANKNSAGILVTVDGGRRWFASHFTTPVFEIDGISCVSINECAAVGFDMEARMPRAVALHTSDGGRQWSLATLPPTYVPSAGSPTSLDTVNCRSSGDCVAMGAGPSPPAQPVNCGTGCSYVPGPTSGTVALWALTSTDGGATWSSGRIVENSMPDEAYQVTCPTTTTCAGVGFGFSSCPPGQKCGAHGLAFYYDATATTPWSLVSVPTGIFSVDSLSCPTTALCLAVGSTGDAESGHGVVLRSLNGGSSWQRLRAPDGSNAIHSISCANARVCVAAGGLGTSSYVRPTMFLTTNGGVTWRDEAVPAVGFTNDVACPNVHFCVMTGSLSIYPAHGLILGGYA
ncbi:MAG: sialidase family protein [Acidimicrobiales bacterium]